MRGKFALINLLAFQVVWFVAVIAASHGNPWAGPVAALFFAVGHFIWTDDRAGDLRLILVALCMGLIVDSALAASGLIRFDSPWPSEHLAPVWILAMWAGFSLTLNHSMRFLRSRWWLAALFGLIGGPLSYWGAAQGFGALAFGDAPMLSLGALALLWGLALPMLYTFRPKRPSDSVPLGAAT